MSQQAAMDTSMSSELIPMERTVGCSWWKLCSKTGGGRLGKIWLVDNNCINNQQLTPLLNLSLVQRLELWVLNDNNFARIQGVEDWTRLWYIITVSTISNCYFSEVWAYYKGHYCGLFQMSIFGDNKDLEINSTIWHWHLIPRHLYFLNGKRQFMKEKGVDDQSPKLCKFLK